MAYNLTTTNNTALLTLADGTVDQNATSLSLIGKNYPGYGTFLNENFIKLLENFANGTSPANAIPGQLWWDSTNSVLKVNSATVLGTPTWKIISSSTSSGSAPANAIVGDLWWDTINTQLKVYSGSSWVTIGPAFTATTGQSGAIADTITAGDGPHTVVKFFIANTLVGILSKDSAFTPSTAIPGFTGTIKPGFNFATQSPALVYYGDANSALNLNVGGTLVPAANFLRSDVVVPTSQQLQVQTNSGIQIGAGSDLTINIANNSVNLVNNTNGYDTTFYTKVNSVNTKVLTLSGSNGLLTVRADPVSALGVATKQYVDSANVAIKSYIDDAIGSTNPLISTSLRRDGANTITGVITPDANNTRNMGTSALRFATVYATTFNGTSTTAQYADLAERFEADTHYPAGTVVELGGEKEITKVVDELSETVFGVISTKAAYLMNSAAGDDKTHPPVAVSGRVPVQVIGRVKKGDRLVSAGNGLARAASKSEITPWNVIGRALTSKNTDGEGTIEAIVKLNS